MKFSHHIVVSSVISGMIHTIFKSWGLTIASFVSGVLLDLDHLIDYIVEIGFPFDVKKFFHYIYEEKLERLYLFFHGWEWSIVLGLITWSTNWNHWVTGILIGYGQHMFFDALFNTNWSLLSYSLFWRWKNKFISEIIRPRKKGITHQK